MEPPPAPDRLAARARDANALAWASYQRADYPATLAHAGEALNLARAAGERAAEAEALSHLGHVHAGLGDYVRALEVQRRSVELLRETGHLAGLARPMAGLANLYGALGDHDAQSLVFQEALEIARQIGDPPGVISALIGLGAAHLGAGRPENALPWLRQGVAQAEATGFALLWVVGLDHLALALAALGQPEEALSTHRRALALAQEAGNPKGEARQRQRLGALLVRLGRAHEGLRELEAAHLQAEGLGLPRLSEEVHAALSGAHEALGDPERALTHLRAQFAAERARLTEEARQRVGVLSAQTREAWARREAEQQRRQAEALHHAARRDALTGLPNRPAFAERLEEAVRAGSPFALLFLDLDGFKAINDTLGHAAGDELLVGTARLLAASLGEEGVLARLGGDEFTVLAPSVGTPGGAERLARRLAGTLGRPLRVAGQDVFVTASVGISLYPADGAAAEVLLRHADLAMDAAKREGRNRVRRFHPELSARARERLLVAHRLPGALERGEFALHYQPQHSLRTGARTGWEALLRWSPDGGAPVPPGAFIPAAEDSGLIVPVGAWVLDTACARLAAWTGGEVAGARLAVNVSPVQFARADFAATVAGALERHGADPRRLELELTERVVVRDVAYTARQFAELRALGVRLALDDFGAGEAHLGALLHLPFDVLKLDRSLVQPLAAPGPAQRVVRAMRTLAHELGLEVVAEGIETPEQFAAARDLGCDRAQGYWLGRPAPEPPPRIAAPELTS